MNLFYLKRQSTGSVLRMCSLRHIVKITTGRPSLLEWWRDFSGVKLKHAYGWGIGWNDDYSGLIPSVRGMRLMGLWFSSVKQFGSQPQNGTLISKSGVPFLFISAPKTPQMKSGLPISKSGLPISLSRVLRRFRRMLPLVRGKRYGRAPAISCFSLSV